MPTRADPADPRPARQRPPRCATRLRALRQDGHRIAAGATRRAHLRHLRQSIAAGHLLAMRTTEGSHRGPPTRWQGVLPLLPTRSENFPAVQQLRAPRSARRAPRRRKRHLPTLLETPRACVPLVWATHALRTRECRRRLLLFVLSQVSPTTPGVRAMRQAARHRQKRNRRPA